MMRLRHADTPGRVLASDAAIVAVVFSTILFKLVETVADADLWGHVRFGLDHLQTGTLARSDPYSYVAGAQEWINHEWLAELLFAIAYQRLGGDGLALLKIVCGLALLGLVYRHLVARGLTRLRAGIVLLLGYLPASVGLGTVRPQLFTYLAFAVVLLAIEAADRGRWRWLWALPPVFLVWANLHGGFFAGIAALGVWVGAHTVLAAVRRARSAERPPALLLLACLAACLAATLVNPYGMEIWRFLLRTTLVARPEITEWGPLSLVSVEGGLYLALLVVSGAALVRQSTLRSLPLVAVYVVTAPLPLLAQRHLPLFVLAALVVCAGPLSAAWRSGLTGARRRTGLPWLASLTASALVMLVLAFARFDGVTINGGQHPMPARAVAALKAGGTGGNLAVFFNWGEYAIWHLAPAFKVSWDGRRETVYDERAHHTNMMFFSGTGEWDALLREHATDLVLTPTSVPAYNLLKLTGAWELVYEDSFAAIFGRRGSSDAQAIAAAAPAALPPDGHGLPFP